MAPPAGDRASNRSRATTPLSHTSDQDLGDHDAALAHNNLSHYRSQYSTPSVGGGDPTSAAVMNQLGSGGHYYQEVPQSGLHYANHLDEYDSPVLKGGRKFPQGRRTTQQQPGGSSLSSSDNNSDTTYAESDINSSLRAKMAALDNGECVCPLLE